MKNIIIKIILLVGISLSFCGTCSKPGLETTETNKTKILKHNYIVINSIDNSPAEVEVSYSIFVAGNTGNIVKTEKLITPFIFGGEDVQVVYDSLVSRSDKSFVCNRFIRNYSPKGADYLEIKNLSDVKLEYCVISNEPLKYYPIEEFKKRKFSNVDKTKVIKYNPTPIYRGVPVLYLIKPELAPQKEVYITRSDGDYKDGGYQSQGLYLQKIPLKAPFFGDMILNTPFSPSQILDLYKKEFLEGRTLYKDYLDYNVSFYGGVNGDNSLKSNGKEMEAYYYNTISAKQTLSNTGQVWFINNYLGYIGDNFDEFLGLVWD